MLEIFNKLELFFKDNFRRINVREYARLQKISPPSASKILNNFSFEKLLIKENYKNYQYYLANKENPLFINLSRLYWQQKLESSGLLNYFQKETINPLIILFGSFSKAEINENSDIDISIFTSSKVKLNIKKFEKKLGRKIQLFIFKDSKEVKNKHLLNNIYNGLIISGNW
tara:strand:+ start:3477 stop:3989 length:513 start_codon:yes stop_codon:yes gene_type:complete